MPLSPPPARHEQLRRLRARAGRSPQVVRGGHLHQLVQALLPPLAQRGALPRLQPDELRAAAFEFRRIDGLAPPMLWLLDDDGLAVLAAIYEVAERSLV